MTALRRRRAPTRAVAQESPDTETRATDDHHESLRLWLRLLACTNLIEARVRRALQTRFGTTLPRFDLMAQLERAPRGLRMSELSRRMMVTGGNVTGITDMLEQEGLVLREPDAEDRRACRVRLTREGSRVFRAMAAEHARWIIELFAGLSAREKAELGELLVRLKKQIVDKNEAERRSCSDRSSDARADS